MSEVIHTRTVAAAPGAVWAALEDFGAISHWAPDVVDHSSLATEQPDGIGAARRIQTGRIVLIERIVTWEPGTALGYELEGLPPLLGTVTNTWRVEPSGSGSAVSLSTAVDAGNLSPKRILARVATRRLSDTSEKLLSALATHVEESS